MKHHLPALVLVTFLLPQIASAQSGRWDDDAPIPYSDEEEVDEGPPRDASGRRQLPGRSDPSADFREEADWEEQERELRLARLDDPFLGIGGSVLGGGLLLSSARGELAEPNAGFGARVTWEYGRLIAREPWDEALFADLTWIYGRSRDGTERVFNVGQYHYFSLAPAYELHVDRARTYGFYGQLGGGFGYQHAALSSDGQVTTIAGIKPVFQYGVGFRARPQLAEGVRLVLRAELTRFRRGYMNDTLIAASVGAGF